MSSPDAYWGDDDLNSAILTGLAAFEANHAASTSRRTPEPASAPAPARPPPQPLAAADSDDFFDLTLDFDASDLKQLDDAIEKDIQRKTGSSTNASSSRTFSRTTSVTRQTTLFGDVLPADSSPSKRAASSRRDTAQNRSPVRTVNRKIKKWDHTAFAKTGKKRKSVKGKEKEASDGEADGDDDVEFQQFPAPFPPPMKLEPDLLAARRWLYPLNRPKRDYQFNISRHCLFDNALVALPTGLGKTFIAGVVMLNFYRWFPDGKVIFVAPTKPLVAQQIDACHKTCGIPGGDAVELTGGNAKPVRARAWREKRVFYMTPQTLENDIKNELCDPRDIILLVIDEAHKGTGDYSYAKVVRLLMAKNPHFHAVQAIVDSLHISRIELRDEQSLDIRGYINEKKVEQHIIPVNEGIGKLRDLLAKVLDTYLKKCINPGILRGNLDPILFHPYRAMAAMDEVRRRPDGRQLQWAFPVLKKIGTLARAMGYLLEASPQMCFRSLSEEAEGTGSGKSSGLSKDTAFQALMDEFKSQKTAGFATHPKLEKLKLLVIHHFGQRASDANGAGGEPTGNDTRAMVFVTFREAVDEIVDFLNQESPLIRASKFIGQGTDKQGKKGIAQREQLEIIDQFKKGKFNVLVATSVGEEGLDIGEVDMIVCYDAQKTPIRMLQRVGRTGRKREGYVHVLLAEGREEANWNKAREAYNDVQKSIVRGEQLELYNDVERLLPESIKPECLEMVMEIEEYDRDRATTEKARETNAPHPREKKRKRNEDPGRDIPLGASTGFVSVAELLVKQKVKRRKKPTAFDKDAGLDDDTDEEIEAGPLALRRAVSTSAASSKPPKAKIKRAKTTDESKKKKGKKKARAAEEDSEPTPSQFVRKGEEDSDDMEIERGLRNRPSSPPTKPSGPKLFLSSPPRSSSPELPLAHNQSIIDICTSAGPSRSPSPVRKRLRSASPQSLEDAPVASQATPPTLSQTKSLSPDPSDTVLTPEPPFGPVPSDKGEPDPEGQSEEEAEDEPEKDDSLAWLLADSDEGGALSSSPVQGRARTSRREDSDAAEIVEDSEQEREDPSVLIVSPPPRRALQPTLSSRAMPPPALLPPHSRAGMASPAAPEATLPVRLAGRAKKRAAVPELLSSSSPLHAPAPPHRRLRRGRDSSPTESSPQRNAPRPKRRKLKLRDTAEAARLNPWIDVEADHSGEEVSGGPSEPSGSDREDARDRRFVTEMPATQASPSYDQAAVYRQSLLSQAPAGAVRAGPAFARPPVRRGATANIRALSPRRRAARLSSPPLPDEEDHYMLGSFVVDDEAEISYNQSSEA
ncbi:hypothetical protein BC834DRAFT_859979 [Gloeopeniophorella convolvens]|nr:hypothetical protein BC834DRAFT_859979 [Gloeopeniophorella convolvens]